ncbi:DUF3558 domain-containing protein [Mycolicibacterium vaccae]|jgi:hypothetical protein|uniref:DUF3558 domain-containing protein n=1 Tax=Mycolicibacterium vaccae ATCC 25954 TaxID=1194972 RepID=K0UUG3_MYCVA|nr:DUF3558 domain-containing protein [Mycolicibacterium vaccae]ANI39417.1 membrane protein [Mycolicibacterium vaccae 95051]EJZ06238.1 hypothetical protein MVAC_22370 [Mycolicibacterium vaccae ATCC 25954]MCV7063821.1 DUF3558 domain-containing protein [Mycolicibacterium vaccae]
MVAKLRLFSALCALVAAVMVVWQTTPAVTAGPDRVDLRSTFVPLPNATTTIKWPVLELTDPDPFNPCEEIPLDAVSRLGLAFSPPAHEDGLRCKYDAGNYQMAVETIVWRTYEETLPADAVELDINGHRAAQFWIMKPTDWNNRWWITCMVAFKTSYGVIQQSLFYSPVYSEPDPDCMQTNLQRAHELSPYYVF